MNKDKGSKNDAIRYTTIAIILGSFLLGFLSLQIISNYIHGEVLVLSTLDVLSFFFGTTLSVTSIVLAVVAIMLSKLSEDKIVSLYDKSSKGLSDLFSRHQEILSRIETSSGINEKRIDDIARRVASLPPLNERERNNEIRNIIRKSATNGIDYDEDYEQHLKELRERSDDIKKFENEVASKIANIEGVKIQKIGSGRISGEKYELADVVCEIGGETIAVSAFYEANFVMFTKEDYKNFFSNLAAAIQDGTFSKSVLIFRSKPEEIGEFMTLYNSQKSLLNSDIAEKISIISGDLEQITNSFQEIIKQPVLQ